MQIPNAMPVLSAGGHAADEGKACIMEYVALLAGEEWTDDPECTHRTLSWLARNVNDRIDDEHRHVLVPLIGRLFGTSEGNEDLAVTAQIRAAAATTPGYGTFMARSGPWGTYCVSLTCSCKDGQQEMSQEEAAQIGVAILTAALDAYDAYMGRTEHHQVTAEEYANLVSAVA